jgi:hypothetical protein
VRARWSLPIFAVFVILAFLTASIVAPDSGYSAFAGTPTVVGSAQSFEAAGGSPSVAVRDGFTVSKAASVPTAGVPDPSTAQGIALAQLTALGLGASEFDCLVSLWDRESHWNVSAANASGAYGIPQALPGSKMASAGADWETNPATQISWGLSYIADRYGSPCGAWAHSEDVGWY